MFGHWFKSIFQPLSLAVLAGTFAFSTLSPSFSQAAFRCDGIHSGVQPFTAQWRVERQAKDIVKDESGNVDFLKSGGALYVSELPLSQKSRTAVMELVRLLSETRSVSFSFKEFVGKDFGKLVLGLPLANKYSLEVIYKSDFREGQARFGAEELRLITPSGKVEIIRKNLQTIEGGFDPNFHADLSDYPGLAQQEFMAHLPSEISGEALAAFSKIAEEVSNLTKPQMVAVSKARNFWTMKVMIRMISMKNWVKDYLIGRYFARISAAGLIAFGTISAGHHYMPETTAMIQNAYHQTMDGGSQVRWVLGTFDRAQESTAIPSKIKSQIQELRADFQTSLKNASPLDRQQAPDLDSSKIKISKDQYMWLQRAKDPKTNRDVVLIVVTRDNNYGKVEYAMTEIDPKKYQSLIEFFENRGQILPVAVDGVTQ